MHLLNRTLSQQRDALMYAERTKVATMATLVSVSWLSMCIQNKTYSVRRTPLNCTLKTVGCTHTRWTCLSGRNGHRGQLLSIVDVHTKMISVEQPKMLITNLYLEESAEPYSFTAAGCRMPLNCRCAHDTKNSAWKTLLNCTGPKQPDALVHADRAEVWPLWTASHNYRWSYGTTFGVKIWWIFIWS